MKKLILYSITGVACILAFFLFSGTTCNDGGDLISPTDEDKCGVEMTDKLIITNDYLKVVNLDDYHTRDGDFAVYTFTIPSPDDVCPHKHVNVIFTLSLNHSVSSVATFRAEVLYGILYNYPLNDDHWKLLESDISVALYEGTANFGISPSFGNDPGWYKPFLTLYIRSDGDMEKDHEKLIESVRVIMIEWKHYKYKEPESK